MTVLESDLTLIEDPEAKTHDAYLAFVREMAGRSYGSEALNDAWIWFKLGWEWSRGPISYQCPQCKKTFFSETPHADSIGMLSQARLELPELCRKCDATEQYREKVDAVARAKKEATEAAPEYNTFIDRSKTSPKAEK